MRWDPRVQECIPALTTGSAPRLVKTALPRVFMRADELSTVCADTPGETVALIEYLLAVLYAADCYPHTATEWRRWVERRESLALAAEWLMQQPDHAWDLFHPVVPLGQNAALSPHLHQFGVGPAQLFIERAGDYNQFFDHHHLHHADPVPADAAWRAMLTQHAYGLGGRAMIKAKAMGLPAALTNQAVGRLGGRVRVLALGETLGDTLRLNLAPPVGAPGTLNMTWSGRQRRAFARTGAGEARMPDGPADLHSVLGRSIIMRPTVLPDGSLGVDRVLMGAGEILADLPAAFVDDAVTFQLTSGKRTFLKPSPARDLWRESHALYAAVAERDKGADLYGRLALLSDRRINLWAVGIIARQTKVTSWVADTFPYVPGREADLRHASEAGSQIAEYTAKALYRAAQTAQETAYPSAKPADKTHQIARFNGEPELWGAAAPAFHALLEAVADGTSPTDALKIYGAEIRATAIKALDARLMTLPVNGQGMQTRALAQQRLLGQLNHRNAPHHLKEATARV